MAWKKEENIRKTIIVKYRLNWKGLNIVLYLADDSFVYTPMLEPAALFAAGTWAQTLIGKRVEVERGGTREGANENILYGITLLED